MGESTIVQSDSIEGSGFPLAFKVSAGSHRPAILRNEVGSDVFRVEARAMGGHQKEAVVTQGDGGTAWRLTSDEGPGLGGSDLAPFPLGFFNAAQQADFLGRIARLAQKRGIDLQGATTTCDNHYASEGSFFTGSGRGSAQAPTLSIALRSTSRAAAIAGLVRDAVGKSALLALARVPLVNTFALYVNGKRVPVSSMPASLARDELDPFKAHRGAPRPLLGAAAPTDLIRKARGDQAAVVPRRVPGDGRVEIPVHGNAELLDPRGLVSTETWLAMAPASRFVFKADERGDGETAPTGVALGLAGIAFCYMTQLIRYVEYRKYKVRAVRMVQTSPLGLVANNGGPLQATVGPTDTHLYVHAEEPDEVMQALLALGAIRCYLHATLAESLTPRISATLNGDLLTL